jgi:hypothetical protein
MSAEITKLMALSTSHVTEQTAKALDDESADFGTPHYDYGGYGWILVVPPNKEAWDRLNCPPELRTVLEFAGRRGCERLLLDRDAPPTPDLPTWEW